MQTTVRHVGKMADKLKIVVFLGSVREGRLGDRVAKFVVNRLESKHEVTLLDPLKLDLPLLKKPMHYYMDKEMPPKILKECNDTITAADAFLVLTAEYNHSIPPALSNLMDHFGSSGYSYKPSGIVCYSAGLYGGMRAAMQLRCFLSELGALSVSNIFGIPEVQKALDEHGNPQNEHMDKGLKRLMDQLEWHACAMKNHRKAFGVPK